MIATLYNDIIRIFDDLGLTCSNGQDWFKLVSTGSIAEVDQHYHDVHQQNSVFLVKLADLK